MSSLKRSHGTQRNGKFSTTAEQSPASKRLKSSHGVSPGSKALASLLDTSNSNRKQLTATVTNGLPSKTASKVDESRTNISSNVNGVEASSAISISSDDGSDDGSDEEEEAEPITNAEVEDANDVQQDGVEPAESTDVEMVNGDQGEVDEVEEPSFGDLLKARHPNMIDVHASLPDPHAEPPHLLPGGGSNTLLGSVTGLSLATVLQQALKTNDKEMLESCFQLKDITAVRNTIQRLPSPLVGSLLTRIAERMHKRPGRAGKLMHWIQWSLVAHGGYLASQPEILKKLKALNQVIKQRAQGLQPLVQLKGKLDMLAAQLELRREVQAQRLRVEAPEQEEAVLYIEGKDDDDWAVNSDVAQIEAAQNDILDEDIDEADDSAEEQDDGAQNGMFDVEAEETDDDEGEDSEEEGSAGSDEDMDDLDDDEEDDEDSDDNIQVATPSTLNRKR